MAIPLQVQRMHGHDHEKYHHRSGRSHPLGAVPDDNGVNFSIYSQHATSVELLIFDNHDSPEPVQVIKLDPQEHRTVHFWHIYVEGLGPGANYAYRLDGPHEPDDLHYRGFRFNRNKVLIDPYARGNTKTLWNRVDACGPGDNLTTSMRSSVVDLRDYDWEGDQPLDRPLNDTIIYEMHAGGFTKSPTSECDYPGKFAGIIEKIPYLKELGVTAVELMPVFEFDPSEIDRVSSVTGERLTNYWGYSPIGFFNPHDEYCVSPGEAAHVREFRDMVKALHKAGIEVILDVVFNHTGEGNEEGPTISFKGIGNDEYYHLVESDKQYYKNYSGCGNTLNCNHPIMEKFIVECLVFWVKELHVDGFRFDIASILSRGPNGEPMADPPVLWQIELSDALADTKIIAEAWDAGGLYQVGYFPGYRWAEWNGPFRDDVRRFVKGDSGLVGAVASRVAGSADLYQADNKLPVNSINFITAHDGFTLNDLVSYNWKHNEANGEDNRDGADNNNSWNCGAEGETDDPEIEALRQRQIKNFVSILMLSQGVPMILSGDEIRRTQKGNNNCYCQDNELSWFDWNLARKNADMFRFFKHIIQFRKSHPALCRNYYFTGEVNERGLKDISWHGCRLYSPGWDNPSCGVLAFTLGGFRDNLDTEDDPDMEDTSDTDIHVMLNMEPSTLEFEIPVLQDRSWYKAVDTAQPSPRDIAEPGCEARVEGDSCQVEGHSVVVLISKQASGLANEPVRTGR